MKPKTKPTTAQLIDRIYRRQIEIEKNLQAHVGLTYNQLEVIKSGQKMLAERISSLYEFIEKSHDEMHALVNGSDIPEFPALDESL